MNESPAISKVLRRLYLTLFLRGRSARGLEKDKAPKSVASKLFKSLLMYAVIGLTALTSAQRELFVLSSHLHGMTMIFLALFVSASAGEVLFSDREPEILLHRPVTASQLLWAKIRVMVEVSLWLALAFNLTGLVVGVVGPHGHPLFVPAHVLSTIMAAMFCSGGIVLLYQLCLRAFGRQRLENLMTVTQVLLVIAIIGISQLAPRMGDTLPNTADLSGIPKWLLVFPPLWFAGFDAALTGHATGLTLGLATTALLVSVLTPWLAVVRLAGSYESGLQTLTESSPVGNRSPAGRSPWLDRLMKLPGVRWLLRDPWIAVGFRLVVAHLLRDRDTKLRFYPGLAPILVMPVVFLIPSVGKPDLSIGIALAGGYLATLPLLAMNILQFSSHWEASDLFRWTPMPGPGPLIHGSMRAVMLLVAAPTLLILNLVILLIPGAPESAMMILPGVIAMPVYAYLAGAIGKTIPFSRPSEQAKTAGRGASLILLMMSSFVVSGLAIAAHELGFLEWYLTAEIVIAISLCLLLGKSIDRTPWPPTD